MKKFLSTSGFIDPISLITLGFLIVGLVVTTAIVKNPDINLDIRDWARMSTGRCPDGSFAPDGELKYCPKAKTPTKPAPAKQQTAPAQPPAPTQKQQQEQAPTEEKSEPVAAVQTPPKKTCTEGYLDTTGECRDGRMCRTLRSIECEITTLCDGPPCTANSARFIPTIPPPPATLPPPPPTYTCTNTAGQYCSPEGCGPNTFGTGSCPSTKTCCKPRPSPSPSAAPTIKCSSFGSCYRETYTCEKEFGQLDCRDGFICGVHCSAPPTPPITVTKSDYQKCLDTGNTPSECAAVAQNIGKTITTPLGQQECVPGTKLCSSGNLKTCSASGTWGLTTCSNGCENGTCKPKPNPLAALNELGTPSGLGAGAAIPLPMPQSAITSPQGFKQYAEAVGSGLGTGLAVGSVVLGGAALITPKTIAAANLVDDTATAIACAQGNQNACAYILPAIANPIPGMSLASQYADDLTALSRPITNFFDEAASILRLGDDSFGMPSGSYWDLGTGQTGIRTSNTPNISLAGTTFADDALLSVVNRQYVSGGGTQRVIIDPVNDPYLAQYLDEAQRFIKSQRTSQRVSRVPLAQQFVTQTFPGYSGTNIPRNLIEETMAKQQSIYRQRGGTAYLGEFINCQAGVCREQSLILHNVLAGAGKQSEVVTGYLGSGGKHAWTEFVDSVTGQRMVADSVWDFVLPIEEAYQIYGGVSNITSQVFVVP